MFVGNNFCLSVTTIEPGSSRGFGQFQRPKLWWVVSDRSNPRWKGCDLFLNCRCPQASFAVRLSNIKNQPSPVSDLDASIIMAKQRRLRKQSSLVEIRILDINRSCSSIHDRGVQQVALRHITVDGCKTIRIMQVIRAPFQMHSLIASERLKVRQGGFVNSTAWLCTLVRAGCLSLPLVGFGRLCRQYTSFDAHALREKNLVDRRWYLLLIVLLSFIISCLDV